MVDYKEKEENEKDDIIETIFSIPIKNLEDRVKLLENDIRERQQLSDDAITRLGTQQVQLQEKIEQLQYSSGWGEALGRHLQFQYIDLEVKRIREMIECFRDISNLEEKLLSVKSDLEMEKQKLKLIR